MLGMVMVGILFSFFPFIIDLRAVSYLYICMFSFSGRRKEMFRINIQTFLCYFTLIHSLTIVSLFMDW